jgi:LytR cell envelope-related transcriptional attenuator
VAAKSNPIGRAVMMVLGIAVVALVLSTVWARLRPRSPLVTHGPVDRVVRVQVLNGSGESGIAARVASRLREGGYHVSDVRNADRSDYFASMVVARREDVSSAQAVARYLGGTPVIRQSWTSDLAEVTVVIGSDRSRLRLD